MGNAQGAAERSEEKRILDLRDRGRAVSVEPPALGDALEQGGPILEPGAADDALRPLLTGERRQRLEQRVRRHAALEAVIKTYVRAGDRDCIQIAEEIRDQRRIAAASGRRGESPAR